MNRKKHEQDAPLSKIRGDVIRVASKRPRFSLDVDGRDGNEASQTRLRNLLIAEYHQASLTDPCHKNEYAGPPKVRFEILQVICQPIKVHFPQMHTL